MAGRVLAYSHDGYGLGHFRRNSRLLAGLHRRRPDVETLLVTGAKAAGRMRLPNGARVVQLPSVVKVANGRYTAEWQNASVEEVLARRSELIVDAVERFRPDVLLVDRYPRGMHDELAAALRALPRVSPGARTVLGLRDIIDEPDVVRREWALAGHEEAIRGLYDRVLFYGDRAVFDPITAYGLSAQVAAKATFTGYLGDDLAAPDADVIRSRYTRPGHRLAVCMLGGGRDAHHVADAFLSAVNRLAPSGWDALLVTGPYMRPDDVGRLQAHPAAETVPILEMVTDAPDHLAAADVAVCMGGYNTMCEVVALAVPAVVVPRVQPRREQLMRCQRFAERGLVSYLAPDQLRPYDLAIAISTASERARTDMGERFGEIAHRGVDATAEILDSLLPVRARA